jgi:hypothetical protein
VKTLYITLNIQTFSLSRKIFAEKQTTIHTQNKQSSTFHSRVTLSTVPSANLHSNLLETPKSLGRSCQNLPYTNSLSWAKLSTIINNKLTYFLPFLRKHSQNLNKKFRQPLSFGIHNFLRRVHTNVAMTLCCKFSKSEP